MKLANYVLPCIKQVSFKRDNIPQKDIRMNTSMVLILAIILGLLGHVGAYAEQPLQLEAKEGYYQFPFFDTRTPVWSYNDQIPGPLIVNSFCLTHSSL